MRDFICPDLCAHCGAILELIGNDKGPTDLYCPKCPKEKAFTPYVPPGQEARGPHAVGAHIGEVKVMRVIEAHVGGDVASLIDENGHRWDLYIKDSQLKLKFVPKPKVGEKTKLAPEPTSLEGD